MKNKTIVNTIAWFFLGLFIVYSLIPVYFILITSLKTRQELFGNVTGLPKEARWGNYRFVWHEENFKSYFVNSIFLAVPSVFLVLICSSLAGYAFAKMKFPGDNVIFFIFLMGLTIPIPSIMIPLYYNLARLNLLDTRIGAILSETAISLPFGIFLMRTFFRGIPDQLIDAARIDGANEFSLLTKVVLPLAQPGLRVLALIEFMWAWQSYLLPLIIFRKEDLKPLTLAIDLFQGRYLTDYTLVATAAVIVFSPITIVFLYSQRSFAQGLSMGALKE